jgi:hypothetical protein
VVEHFGWKTARDERAVESIGLHDDAASSQPSCGIVECSGRFPPTGVRTRASSFEQYVLTSNTNADADTLNDRPGSLEVAARAAQQRARVPYAVVKVMKSHRDS